MADLRLSGHEHPLEPVDLTDDIIHRLCEFCRTGDIDNAYVCRGCKFYVHDRCAKAPPRIQNHPFHPIHPLTLVHRQPVFRCGACDEVVTYHSSKFRCEECRFDLDLRCALSTLPPDPREGSPLEYVDLPFHHHQLISFFARREFGAERRCVLCREPIEGDGYVCSHPRCKFTIHKRCIEDVCYVDGTKAPRVYHEHKLEDFTAVSIGCANCGSDATGEYVGCAVCKVYIHRDCCLAAEILNYPPHPDHPLVLFVHPPSQSDVRCRSCSGLVQAELCYRCLACEFDLHIGCGLRTLAYSEEGMSVEIRPSWHEHSMFLCCRTDLSPDHCSCCVDKIDGPAYRCETEGCQLVLHKKCTELQLKIESPHHQDHSLILLANLDEPRPSCNACRKEIVGFSFYCEPCLFYLDVKCASRFPTRKHYLHEHDLIRFDEISYLECNRCRMSDNSPIFCCIPCNFNLHEKCMELPGVVKHKTHFHPLTLRETFVEDDSGEYYCDLCEKRRDGRLGVYICGECKMDRPWAFHIECVLPELRTVYMNVHNPVIKRLAEEIMRKEEEAREMEEKLQKINLELDELRKKHEELISEEEKNINRSSSDSCSCCGDKIDGLAYRCEAEGCRLVLHKKCTELQLKINHPHYPEHPLIFLANFTEARPSCGACRKKIVGFRFYMLFMLLEDWLVFLKTGFGVGLSFRELCCLVLRRLKCNKTALWIISMYNSCMIFFVDQVR